MKTYTVKRVFAIDEKLKEWIINVAVKVNDMYDSNAYDLRCFDFPEYISNPKTRVTVCFNEKDEPKGIMMSRTYISMWDFSKIIYKQDLLYGESPNATYLLLKDFIDFGKKHADHIITMIGAKTNLKGSSLEKLGFAKLEESYIIRGNHGQ